MRTSWSRIGASACRRSAARRTRSSRASAPRRPRSAPNGRRRRCRSRPARAPGAISAATCGRLRQVLADVGALRRGREHLAARIDDDRRRLFLPTWASPSKSERKFRSISATRDAGVEAGMRHRDRHQRPRAGEIGRRVADAARDRFGEARIAAESRMPVDERDLGARQAQQLAGPGRRAATAAPPRGPGRAAGHRRRGAARRCRTWRDVTRLICRSSSVIDWSMRLAVASAFSVMPSISVVLVAR